PGRCPGLWIGLLLRSDGARVQSMIRITRAMPSEKEKGCRHRQPLLVYRCMTNGGRSVSRGDSSAARREDGVAAQQVLQPLLQWRVGAEEPGHRLAQVARFGDEQGVERRVRVHRDALR